MMKLIAFRIRNFRSIIDTGWQSLSPDNITCLIGQNESGKTSVLEGLRVFHTGVISEDVLRSDMSLPEVYCRFKIPAGWLLKVTDNPGTELRELLKRLDHIELKRAWIADLSSVVMVSGEISDYLNSLEDAWNLYLKDVGIRITEEMDYIRHLEKELNQLSEQETAVRNVIYERDRKNRSFTFLRSKKQEKVASGSKKDPDNQLLDDLKGRKEVIQADLKSKQVIRSEGLKWDKLRSSLDSIDQHLADLSVRLEERHQKMTLLMRPTGEDDEPGWKNLLSDFRKTTTERDTRKEEIDRHVAMMGYILEGNSSESAARQVDEILRSYKSQFNTRMLGEVYFNYCPVFELFEDFGSLLPNRIDMGDILSGNEMVEGYKAARNFMDIAKLDYSFFQQPSSRILKQKIENLNNILTRNFQDFWQQSVGRNNKINIQFELDHYSSSYGEKAGKPYLEFWIKDEGERLYPKQRSRGVRWFLSFYMELKAAASMNREMVLLVDEPGVSLHARAQEDVLKVFEDIKEKIQVIYTTHSPHLVEINKLHRVLAVQRDDMESYRSATRIIDPLRLSAASPDTLTPLQSILGNPLRGEGFSSAKLNLIVNDTGTFYILSAMLIGIGFKGRLSIIPAANVESIPLLSNILLGWGMDFAVLLFSNEKENQIAMLLKDALFNTDTDGKEKIIRLPDNMCNAEDLLSTLDFKKHIIKTREGITISNSEYIRERDLPRNFLFSRFLADIKSGTLSIEDFDEETNENIRMLADILSGLNN